jgi:hypothetical protein
MVALWQAGSRFVVYRWLPSVYCKRWLILNNIVPALFKHVVVNSRLSSGEILRTLSTRSSQNPQKAKFAENLFHALQ